MAADSMYETLLGLPLFKGVSHERISEILETSRFHFLRYKAGETVVETGEECTHLKFVISGSMRLVIESDDGRLKVGQTLTAPDVVCPSFLFGMNNRYPGRGTALGDDTAIVQVSKADYLRILHKDEVFMFNLLNMLSKNSQRKVEGVMALTRGSVDRRIALWILSLTQTDAQDIVMECRHRDLYILFGVSRSIFYQALEDMRRNDIVDYEPGRIMVKSRRALREFLFGE